MQFFLAGIMQGSHLGEVLHHQGYRGRLKQLLATHFPARKCMIHWPTTRTRWNTTIGRGGGYLSDTTPCVERSTWSSPSFRKPRWVRRSRCGKRTSTVGLWSPSARWCTTGSSGFAATAFSAIWSRSRQLSNPDICRPCSPPGNREPAEPVAAWLAGTFLPCHLTCTGRRKSAT